MQVKPVSPRGYCHGVVSAIKTVREIAKDDTLPRPIYILGMLVHNKKIIEDIEALGLHTLDDRHKSRLELIETIDKGTIVFTAHGVSDTIYQKASAKNLTIIDTTCVDVKQSQNTIKTYLKNGYDILFIGKQWHPESQTVKDYSPRVHIIEKSDDIDTLAMTSEKVALTNQTTMSLYDIHTLAKKAEKKYPNLKVIEEICDATRLRQRAVMHLPQDVDHLFVVGDQRSNNSQKLKEVAVNHGTNASLIETVEDIDIEHLKTLTTAGVTSGASTPTQVTKEVIHFLKAFDKEDKNTWEHTSKLTKNLFK